MVYAKRVVLGSVVLAVSIALVADNKVESLIKHYTECDFYQGMASDTYAYIVQRKQHGALLDFFNQLYKHKNNCLVNNDSRLRIPKIIHQIWLGRPMPKEYEQLQESWRHHHPDWHYILWTEEMIQEFGLYNQVYYDMAQNYGEKSDIARYEILYRFGGLYVDCDFECLQSLEGFHYLFDFYTGVQPLDTNMVQLGCALIGSIPGHPILKHCIETVKDDQRQAQIVVKTGPIHFTKSFVAAAGKDGLHDVAFPATFFYPCGYEQRGQPRTVWMTPYAYAVHHWAGSWLKPEAFVSS